MAETNSTRIKNTDPDDPSIVTAIFPEYVRVSFPNTLTVPGSSDAGPYIEITAFEYERSFRKSLQEDVLYKVYLPFPFQGINYNNSANYDPFNALLGRTAGDGVGGTGTAALEAAGSLVGQAAGNAAADIAAAAASKMRVSVDADRVKSQSSTIAGLTFNPRQELSFNGTDLRQYNFSYILLPRNQIESEQIQKIIEILEESTYPDYEDKTKVFLKYPHEFVLSFFNPDGTHIKGAPLIPDTFMTNFSYAINPTSAGRTFPDGSPTSYTINMNFAESNYLTRTEIRALRQNIIPVDAEGSI